MEHTRHNIAGVQGIFVLDEAKAAHELDLGDFSSAMGVKVRFNIGLGGCTSCLSATAPPGNVSSRTPMRPVARIIQNRPWNAPTDTDSRTFPSRCKQEAYHW